MNSLALIGLISYTGTLYIFVGTHSINSIWTLHIFTSYNTLNPWSGVIFQELLVSQLITKYRRSFMKLEGSLPHLQKLAQQQALGNIS
jgi:hypothetical protein